jgi:glycosyltransferase involved in cell wall biosynthesis
MTRGFFYSMLKIYRIVGYVAGLSESSLIERIKIAGMVFCSLDFVAFARRSKLEHVHVHSCAQAAHIVAMAYLLGGPPYSLHLHGDLAVYGKDHASKMQCATFVAAAARPMEREIVDVVGLSEHRVCTCWMGVETDLMVPPSHKEPSISFNITTVARLNRAKGHENVLRAMALLVREGLDIRYAIVGTGPYESSLKRIVLELGLLDRVEFTGTLGEDEVKAVLHRSDAFVLASVGLGEASPVAVMEAMSIGLPVICSLIGGTAQMITDGVDGFLVEKHDIDGIASRLRLLVSSQELRKRLGIAARLRAVNTFDVSRTAAKLLKQIESHAKT